MPILRRTSARMPSALSRKNWWRRQVPRTHISHEIVAFAWLATKGVDFDALEKLCPEAAQCPSTSILGRVNVSLACGSAARAARIHSEYARAQLSNKTPIEKFEVAPLSQRQSFAVRRET